MTRLVSDRVFELLDNRTPEVIQLTAAHIAVKLADDIHSNWIQEHIERFYARAGKEYQFLPSAFIGVKEMSSDLLFAEPVLKAVNLPFDEANIERAYLDQTIEDIKRYKERFGGEPATLETLIARAIDDEDQLPSTLKDKIINDERKMFALTEQVFEVYDKVFEKYPEFADTLKGLVHDYDECHRIFCDWSEDQIK